MQHVLVASQNDERSSYSIFIFVISLFGWLHCLDARGRCPVLPSARHCPSWFHVWEINYRHQYM